MEGSSLNFPSCFMNSRFNCPCPLDGSGICVGNALSSTTWRTRLFGCKGLLFFSGPMDLVDLAKNPQTPSALICLFPFVFRDGALNFPHIQPFISQVLRVPFLMKCSHMVSESWLQNAKDCLSSLLTLKPLKKQMDENVKVFEDPELTRSLMAGNTNKSLLSKKCSF